jgi:hypothetical protein
MQWLRSGGFAVGQSRGCEPLKMTTGVALSQFDRPHRSFDTGSMKPKRPRDANQLAKFIVDLSVGNPVKSSVTRPEQRLKRSQRIRKPKT